MHWGFISKLAIIVVPFLSVIVMLSHIALSLGDANPPLLAVYQQDNNPDLIYMPPWTRNDQFYYKFTAINHHQPDILIIGSSRVYHWRPDVMFDERGIGYNAGLPSAEPLEALWFLEGLANRNALPNIVILAIDDLFYNESGSFVRSNRVTNVIPPMAYSYESYIGGFRAISRDYIQNPQQIISFYQTAHNPNLLGYTARTEQRGYRADGSFQFSNLSTISPQLLARQTDLINTNQAIFQQGDTVHQPAIDATEQILQLLSNHGIQVIGFFPPYHATQYQAILASGNYDYIPQVRDQITRLFNTYDMLLLDYTFPDDVNGSDDELYDYIHAGDVLGLRVYHDMVLNYPNIFEPYTTIARIEAILDSATDPFYLP